MKTDIFHELSQLHHFNPTKTSFERAAVYPFRFTMPDLLQKCTTVLIWDKLLQGMCAVQLHSNSGNGHLNHDEPDKFTLTPFWCVLYDVCNYTIKPFVSAGPRASFFVWVLRWSYSFGTAELCAVDKGKGNRLQRKHSRWISNSEYQ